MRLSSTLSCHILKNYQWWGLFPYPGEVVSVNDCFNCKKMSFLYRDKTSPGGISTHCPLCSPGSSLWRENLCPLCSHPLSGSWYAVIRSPLTQLLQSFHRGQVVQPIIIFMALLWTLSRLPTSLLTCGEQNRTRCSWHSRTSAEWDGHVSVSACHNPVDPAWDPICLGCCSSTLLTCVWFTVYLDPRSLSARLVPSHTGYSVPGAGLLVSVKFYTTLAGPAFQPVQLSL